MRKEIIRFLNLSKVEFSKKDSTKKLIKLLKDYKNVSENHWTNISCCKLSEEFIKEFKYHINTYYLLKYNLLSENLIRELHNHLPWNYIKSFQCVSKEFLKEFKYKFDPDYWKVERNPYYTELLEENKKLKEELKTLIGAKNESDYVL